MKQIDCVSIDLSVSAINGIASPAPAPAPLLMKCYFCVFVLCVPCARIMTSLILGVMTRSARMTSPNKVRAVDRHTCAVTASSHACCVLAANDCELNKMYRSACMIAQKRPFRSVQMIRRHERTQQVTILYRAVRKSR